MSSKFSNVHANSLRKYQKHVRTLLDEVLFLYFNCFKKSSIYPEFNYDFTEFSGIYYTLESQNELPDFIANLKRSIDNLDDISSKKKVLERLDVLYRYYLKGVQEGMCI